MEQRVRVFVIGDTHFRNKFIETGELLTEKCIAFVEKYKPDFIVLLGDILHSHADTKQSEFDLAQTFIISLSQYAKTFVLIGNHDYINNSQFLSDKHFFNTFKKIENVVIVDKCIHYFHNGMDFVFCPFTLSSRFMEALFTCRDMDTGKEYSYRYARCIFSHIDIFGASYSNGTVVNDECVTKWSKKQPFLISGHIHKNQRLSNVYYPGSSTQVSCDEDPNKIVALITFSEGKRKIKELSLNIPGVYIVKTGIDEIDNAREQIDKYCHIHKVKIRVSATAVEYEAFIKSDKYSEFINLGVIVEIDRKPDDVNESLDIGNKFKTFETIFERIVKKSSKTARKEYKLLFSEN